MTSVLHCHEQLLHGVCITHEVRPETVQPGHFKVVMQLNGCRPRTIFDRMSLVQYMGCCSCCKLSLQTMSMLHACELAVVTPQYCVQIQGRLCA